MAKTTANYGLIKPERSDNYSVDVMSGNMDIIDGELKEHDNVVNGGAIKSSSITNSGSITTDSVTGKSANFESYNGEFYINDDTILTPLCDSERTLLSSGAAQTKTFTWRACKFLPPEVTVRFTIYLSVYSNSNSGSITMYVNNNSVASRSGYNNNGTTTKDVTLKDGDVIKCVTSGNPGTSSSFVWKMLGYYII